MSAGDFVATGRDIESRIAASAAMLRAEIRVALNGHKTISRNIHP
jgi:formyltetrahydrofolate deformylase